MSNELQALCTILALAAAVVAARFLRTGRAQLIAALVLVGGAAAATTATALLRPRPVPEAEVRTRPNEVPQDGYVTSSTCRSCHPHEHATWHDSYHRKMTQRAGPGSVVGDFDDVVLTTEGEPYRLQRRGDEYWVEMPDPLAQGPGKKARVEKRIAMTTGSHNMQAYWYESGHTQNIGLLPFTWLVAEQRWITRRAAFVGPATDAVDHKVGVWNIICLKCHATHARPRIMYEGNVQRGAFTQVAELGIACEACHGPGEAHVAANQNPARRYAQRLSGEPDPTIVNPKRLAPDRSSQVCGQCHASLDYRFDERSLNQWFKDGFRYRPGEDLKRYRDVKHDGEEQFWPDGLIRVAGREYNSIVGSKCHEEGGMSCLSCHVLHQPEGDPRPRAEWANDQLHDQPDDRSCLECHGGFADDVAAHSHHAPGTAGSSCVNCHMPHTTYGLMKGVRNHHIASPDVAVTLATGRPNACSQCHLDKPLAWVAERLHEWYGHDVPELGDEEKTVAVAVQWTLKGDAALRALTAWNLGWSEAQKAAGTDWLVPYAAELVDDPYEVVRLIAARSLRTLPGYDDFTAELVEAGDGPKRAKEAALQRWSGGVSMETATRRPHVLFDAEGKLDMDAYVRLRQRRDNRVIRLFE